MLLTHFETIDKIILSIDSDAVGIMIGDTVFNLILEVIKCFRSRALSISKAGNDGGLDENIAV